jgi:hypothetical protein
MRAPAAAIVFRGVLAIAAAAAVFAQLAVTLSQHTSVVNFFSYFTIESNIIGVVVFAAGAVLAGLRAVPSPLWLAVRGASVVYLAFVGAVFNTVLTGTDLGDLIPWVNVVHHMVMPVAVVVDWLLWPPARRIPLGVAALWLVYPALYTAYSLIRGAQVGFYAYPFFNPSVQAGYGGVAVYCAVLLVAFLVLGLLIRWLGNLRAARVIRRA